MINWWLTQEQMDDIQKTHKCVKIHQYNTTVLHDTIKQLTSCSMTCKNPEQAQLTSFLDQVGKRKRCRGFDREFKGCPRGTSVNDERRVWWESNDVVSTPSLNPTEHQMKEYHLGECCLSLQCSSRDFQHNKKGNNVNTW